MTNTQLARLIELRDQILLTGPEHLAMHSWAVTDGGRSRGVSAAQAALDADTSRWTCGTTACLAGHGATVMKRHGVKAATPSDVARWFGLDSALFYAEGGLYRIHPQDEWEAVLAKLGDIIKTAEADLAGAS